jgi:tetratricopeptide (TPR) repeat protein
MKRALSVLIIILLFTSVHLSYGCTIVMVSRGGMVLAGNNEDWKDPLTCMWFIPASEGEYGRVCFGFSRNWNNPQGGMNDHGLFIDANALAPTGWKPVEGKPRFQGHLIDHILAKCASVDDVIEFLQSYNFSSLARAKFPIADRHGTSLVVEWGGDKLQLLRRDGGYQISTNFVISDYEKGEYPCPRYQIADQILRDAEEYSVDLIREILSATHNEGRYPTLYSNICDLKNGIVYLYNFHHFEDVVQIDLKEELKKGRRMLDLNTLFPVRTHVHRLFLNRSAKAVLFQTIEKRGVEAAIAEYHKMKQSSAFRVGEDDINALGYQMLGSEKIPEAIEIFKLNVKEHPESWNVYDSLGEAYMKHGNIELAIKNYRKSLELNPENTNGADMLEKLQKR